MKNTDKKIVIIGGGISGVMTALSLCEKGIECSILESNNELLKKVLVTGNGRCNFTNKEMSSEKFYAKKDFINNTLEQFSVSDCLSFIGSLGVRYRDVNGYYYPYSNQASTVRNAFLSKLKNSDIHIKTNAKVERLVLCEDGYDIVVQNQKIHGDIIILATGGLVGAGCEGFANSLKDFGVSIVPSKPALVGLKISDERLSCLNGARVRCEIITPSQREVGEIQFGKDYISGIPVMNLSHEAQSLDHIFLNFIPEMSESEAFDEVYNRLGLYENPYMCLAGLTNDKVLDVLKPYIKGIDKESIANSYCKAARSYEVKLSGSLGFDRAQVTAGGVSLDEISYDFELEKMPNIYVCGEATDVDGKCGGYNIHYALASGRIVANAIERKYFD